MSVKGIAAAIGIIVTAVVAGAGAKEGVRWAMQDKRPWASIPDDELIPILRMTADKLNASLPLTADDDTVLVSTDAGSAREFTYHYSLLNHSADEIDGAAFAGLVNHHVLQQSCTNEGALGFLRGNIRVNYVYFDRHGANLHQFAVNPGDC